MSDETTRGTAEGRGPLTVFIVDDHDLFRAGVKSELTADIRLAGDASEVDAAIEMILERLPTVVLLDVHMPGGGGKAVIEGVHKKQPEVLFLAISASDAPEDVVATIRAGARGYVTKTISAEELAAAIRRVAGGDAVFSPKLAGFVLDAFSSVAIADIDPELDQLTDREREVLRHIARGYTYREVGEQLYIAVKTVESHVSNVLRKLQLSNRAELTKWAADRKLI
jgi:DNA-binding NarL/FixJ family response regulator